MGIAGIMKLLRCLLGPRGRGIGPCAAAADRQEEGGNPSYARIEAIRALQRIRDCTDRNSVAGEYGGRGWGELRRDCNRGLRHNEDVLEEPSLIGRRRAEVSGCA